MTSLDASLPVPGAASRSDPVRWTAVDGSAATQPPAAAAQAR
jgi:hypothetical protein